jgi:hypothetical protein
MKNFGAKVFVGGIGSIPSSAYKAHGMKNKRKAKWAYERKVELMLQENRERDLLRQQQERDSEFENFAD